MVFGKCVWQCVYVRVRVCVFVTGSLAVRPQPGHTPHWLPTFAISVLYLVPCWRS